MISQGMSAFSYKRSFVSSTRFWFALFLTPAFCMVVFLYVLPIILTVSLSLTNADYTGRMDFIGIENFRFFLSDPLLGKITLVTLGYVFFTLVFNVGIGLLLALMMDRISSGMATFFRLIWLLPRLTPTIIYILIWRFFIDPSSYGIINRLITSFGYEPVSLLSSYPILIIVIVNGFIGCSLNLMVFSSSLKSIPKDFSYAAQIDGANEFQIIKDITLPILRWPIMFMTVYQTVALFTSLNYILALSDGGPFYSTEVWAIYAYHNAVRRSDFGYGAALSVVIVLAGLFSALIYWRFFKFEIAMGKPKIETL